MADSLPRRAAESAKTSCGCAIGRSISDTLLRISDSLEVPECESSATYPQFTDAQSIDMLDLLRTLISYLLTAHSSLSTPFGQRNSVLPKRLEPLRRRPVPIKMHDAAKNVIGIYYVGYLKE
jgi:hypothetical protein